MYGTGHTSMWRLGRSRALPRALVQRLCLQPRGSQEATEPRTDRIGGCDPHVLAKSSRQRTMLGWFVDRDRLIVMCPTFRKGPRTHQRRTHKTMPKHERNHCSPILGKRQALCRKVEESVAVEPYIVRDPEPIED